LRDGPPTEFEKELDDPELVSVEHVGVAAGLRFKPFLLLTSSMPVTAFATSDIGTGVLFTAG
jgi:hypothetical protein